MVQQLKQIPPLLANIFNILKLMWHAQPIALTGIITLNVLQGLMPVAAAWVAKWIFDLLGQQLSGSATVLWPQLLALIALQTFLMIASQALSPVASYLKAELERQLTLTVQFKIYRKVNGFAGLACFENPKLHDTIRLANEGAQQGANQTISLFTTLIQSTVTLVSFTGVLLSFNLALAGLVILAALPQLYARMKFGRQRVQLVYKVSPDERQKYYFSFLLSGVHAAKEIRLFDTGGYFLDRLLRLTRKVHQDRRQQQKYELRWDIFLGFLSSLVAGIAFVVVIWGAFNGRLTLGDVTLYISAVASVQGSLQGSMFAISGLHESSLFYTYFNNLLALPDPLPRTTRPNPVRKLTSRIVPLSYLRP